MSLALNDAVKKLGVSVLYPGSTIARGTTYQEIPGMDIPSHRKGTEKRARRILEIIDVKDKSVWDFGCSIGVISSFIKDAGADRVYAVDWDKDSLDVGRALYGEKIEWIHGNLTNGVLDRIGPDHIVIWTSQFMWLAKLKGMEYALNFLFELSTKCKALIFETAGRDGMAPLDMDQKDIFGLLLKNTCFQDITDCGVWEDEWGLRKVFRCRDPQFKWANDIGHVLRNSRTTITKYFDRQIQYEREVQCLQLLSGNKYAPKLIAAGDRAITMEYAGARTRWIPESDLQGILKMLRDAKLTHRDIRPENLLWNGENVVLCDFEWALFDGEQDNYRHELGQEFRCPYGFNDEYSLQKVQHHLMRGANV